MGTGNSFNHNITIKQTTDDYFGTNYKYFLPNEKSYFLGSYEFMVEQVLR